MCLPDSRLSKLAKRGQRARGQERVLSKKGNEARKTRRGHHTLCPLPTSARHKYAPAEHSKQTHTLSISHPLPRLTINRVEEIIKLKIQEKFLELRNQTLIQATGRTRKGTRRTGKNGRVFSESPSAPGGPFRMKGSKDSQPSRVTMETSLWACPRELLD